MQLRRGEEFVQVEQLDLGSIGAAEQSCDLVVAGAARGDDEQFPGDGVAIHLIYQQERALFVLDDEFRLCRRQVEPPGTRAAPALQFRQIMRALVFEQEIRLQAAALFEKAADGDGVQFRSQALVPVEQGIENVLDVALLHQRRAAQHAIAGHLEVFLDDGFVEVRVALNPVTEGANLVGCEGHLDSAGSTTISTVMNPLLSS